MRCTGVCLLPACLLLIGLVLAGQGLRVFGDDLALCRAAGSVVSCPSQPVAAPCCPQDLPQQPLDDCCQDLDLGDEPSVTPGLTLLALAVSPLRQLPPWQLLGVAPPPRVDARPWWPPDPGSGETLRELRRVRLLI